MLHVPRQYFIVTPKGVGNSLQDLIDDPPKLRTRLIEKWDAWCLKEITATGPVPLEADLRMYVEEFDFSIVKTLAPSTLIEQHSDTKEHLAVFGSAFKPRPPAEAPPTDVAQKETIYVTSVYEAFGDHLKSPISLPAHFAQHDHLTQCFDHARECFYCAESLKEFCRPGANNKRAH